MLIYMQEYIPITLVQVASILLGVGVFLLWCGLFGILSYFESLNVSNYNAIYALECDGIWENVHT